MESVGLIILLSVTVIFNWNIDITFKWYSSKLTRTLQVHKHDVLAIFLAPEAIYFKKVRVLYFWMEYISFLKFRMASGLGKNDSAPHRLATYRTYFERGSSVWISFSLSLVVVVAEWVFNKRKATKPLKIGKFFMACEWAVLRLLRWEEMKIHFSIIRSFIRLLFAVVIAVAVTLSCMFLENSIIQQQQQHSLIIFCLYHSYLFLSCFPFFLFSLLTYKNIDDASITFFSVHFLCLISFILSYFAAFIDITLLFSSKRRNSPLN